MATFDGENLIMTLDAPTDGVLTQNVQDDWYEQWKLWQLDGNMRFPPVFFDSFGGNDLTPGIQAGAYFVFQNTLGWRIQSSDHDQTIFVAGNIAPADSTLPITIPTPGRTVMYDGLQPITQNIDSIKRTLEFAAYAGGVAVDITNGTAGTEPPVGTRLNPSNNFIDVHTISGINGIREIFIMESMTLTGADMSGLNHIFIGDSPQFTLTIDPSADVTGSELKLLTVVGELDGMNVIKECSLGAVTKVSGFIEKTALQSTMSINNTTFMAECYSQVVGVAYPTITTAANTLIVRDFHGSLGIGGMTGGIHSIEIYGGRLTIEASCTGGTIYMRGAHFNTVNDLSGGAVTIVDQTEAKETADAVWDEVMTDHETVGTTGKTLSDAQKKAKGAWLNTT